MKIHFIGNAGVSMSWLAAHFGGKDDNIVTGSDLTSGGHKAENVDGADLVVYTGAIPEDNAELIRARESGIPVIGRAELLGEVSRQFDKVIAVAGTHGKTTVTGMLASVLTDAAVHIGGNSGGEHGRITGDKLVCEACEYKKSFLYLKRDIAIVLNAEMDHPDFYPDKNAVIEAFKEFSAGAETLVTTVQLSKILCAKDRIVSVGEGGDCFVLSFKPQRYIEISLWGRKLAFSTPLIGKHNASNLAFAAAAAALSGASDDEIAFGLSKFAGVDRRLQVIGKVGDTPLISDYAHHPHEISASVEALRECEMKKLLVVFQPHTFSRLNALFGGFIKSLIKTDTLILPVFAAREKNMGGCDARTLCGSLKAAGCNSSYAGDFETAAGIIRQKAESYNAIVLMGAGNIDILGNLLINA